MAVSVVTVVLLVCNGVDAAVFGPIEEVSRFKLAILVCDAHNLAGFISSSADAIR